MSFLRDQPQEYIDESAALDITPAAATAQIEVARMMHAVPAEEHTKQEVEKTRQVRQLTLQHTIVGAVCSLCAVLIYMRPEAGKFLVGIAIVTGGVYTASLYLNKRRSQPKQLNERAEKTRPPEK